jgi:PKHD-type hydroxylase
MEYTLTPYAAGTDHFAYWDNAFSNEQLDWLQNKARENNEIAGVGKGAGTVDNSIRRSSIRWLFNDPECVWVYKILAHVVSSLNARFFRFDLTGFGEAIQLTNYDSTVKGMYGWHIDHSHIATDSPCRKLSVVLQLSDPGDYEGGNLELKTHNDEPYRIPKRRGLITAFPSWTIHQVSPVTQGTRQSLVIWTTGPSFK